MFEGTTDNKEAIALAIRQTKRWIKAAQQDKDPIVALLHANYSVGVISNLRDMFGDIKIKKTTNNDAFKIHQEAVRLQDWTQQQVQKKYGIKIPREE